MNPSTNFENAGALIGKSILIDLTVHDYNETVVEQKQMHGRITRVSETEGIVVELAEEGGREYRLPADLDRIEPYREDLTVQSTAERCDLMTSLLVHLPPPEFEGPVVQGP